MSINTRRKWKLLLGIVFKKNHFLKKREKNKTLKTKEREKN
jgi:hypothetical protein